MKNIWRSALSHWKEAFTWGNAITAIMLAVIAGFISHFTGYPGEIVIGAIGAGFAVLTLLAAILVTLIRKLRNRT